MSEKSPVQSFGDFNVNRTHREISHRSFNVLNGNSCWQHIYFWSHLSVFTKYSRKQSPWFECLRYCVFWLSSFHFLWKTTNRFQRQKYYSLFNSTIVCSTLVFVISKLFSERKIVSCNTVKTMYCLKLTKRHCYLYSLCTI